MAPDAVVRPWPVTPATVSWALPVTEPTVPWVTSSTVPWTWETVPCTSATTSPARSGTATEWAGISSALATAEPSAHAPETPAAITMERRMFLFMLASDPSNSGFRSRAGVVQRWAGGIRPGGPGPVGGQTCAAPARQVTCGERAALAGEFGDVSVPVAGGRGVVGRRRPGQQPGRSAAAEGCRGEIGVPRRTAVPRRLADRAATGERGGGSRDSGRLRGRSPCGYGVGARRDEHVADGFGCLSLVGPRGITVPGGRMGSGARSRCRVGAVPCRTGVPGSPGRPGMPGRPGIDGGAGRNRGGASSASSPTIPPANSPTSRTSSRTASRTLPRASRTSRTTGAATWVRAGSATRVRTGSTTRFLTGSTACSRTVPTAREPVAGGVWCAARAGTDA